MKCEFSIGPKVEVKDAIRFTDRISKFTDEIKLSAGYLIHLEEKQECIKISCVISEEHVETISNIVRQEVKKGLDIHAEIDI